ncbi:hypothetical protein LPJ59_005097 [Coemansia sp. RSA 2399]|nr:hypothetical protein LPJ59_005097 [Coemansia sp. RSA 2399]KAJ1895653.1 hypothetical protein LPJ81_004915 [Coemansia sp. IMI 209127]
MAAVGRNNRSKAEEDIHTGAEGNRTRTRTEVEGTRMAVEGIRMEAGSNRAAAGTHTGVEVEAGSNMAAGEAVVGGGTARDGRSKAFAVAGNHIFHTLAGSRARSSTHVYSMA